METRAPPHECRRLAVCAECSFESARKFLEGRPLSPLVAQRIQRALDKDEGLALMVVALRPGGAP